MTFRRSVLLSLVLAAAGLLPVTGTAQTFPGKTITLVVPYTAGGGTDQIARIIAPRLAARLGADVIVENKPGAGGLLGVQAVANAAPDGHTLLVMDASFATMAALSPERRNAALKEVIPVSIVTVTPYVIAINSKVPAKNLQEFIAVARSHPGKLTYGSGGNTSASHLAGEWFKSVTSTDILHVPYRGGSAAVQSQAAGETDLTFLTAPSVMQHIKGGRLRGLAVTSAQRSPALPDVPTTSEAGLPKMAAVTWNAVFAPAKIPQPLLARLNKEISAVQNLPEVRAQFSSLSLDTYPDSPQHAMAFIEEEINRWSAVVKAGNIKPE
ncbi:MAG TPA: tripartite tricarboxylate transporter substrate binding protein [Ramlibacter sp.]|nr:tripartite tricarboxylate transporter substrate binding protein [Ramlibacter sp.]